jgi:chromosome segregation ATPase
MSNILENFDPRWRQFLQNPAWYVAAVIILAGLVVYIRFWWWLAGAVALVWGIWLVWQMFGEDKGGLNNEKQLEAYLAQAQLYQAQIQQVLKATSNKRHDAHQQQLATQVNICTRAIHDLAQRIASLHQDTLIYQDMAVVPKAIEDLEAQLADETDATIRTQLERTLSNRRNQLTSLELLQRTIKQAEIQIENTLSLLGTIYSQILTSQSTSHVADYGRLSAGVNEEVARLQDQLEALQEVKGSLGGPNPVSWS